MPKTIQILYSFFIPRQAIAFFFAILTHINLTHYSLFISVSPPPTIHDAGQPRNNSSCLVKISHQSLHPEG